jgi:hypothetical protein
MRTAHLDDAASDPQDPAGQAVAAGARLWRRMVRWVGRLGRIHADLAERMDRVADQRATAGVAEGGFDLQLGWALVTRAARWTRALRTWMREVAVAVPGEAVAPLAAGLDARRGAAPKGPRRAPIRPRGARYGRTDCIEGLTVGEVVAQICADLADAAVLLRADQAGKAIARIAAAARKLLGGPDATWTKQPPPPRWGAPAADAAPASPGAVAAAPARESG